MKKQIEYYFSEENLQRDFFLRRKMDPDGYLPISLIASFHRVQALTQDVNFIIESIKDSSDVEVSEDGIKVRTKHEPEKWPILDNPVLHANVPDFVPGQPYGYGYEGDLDHHDGDAAVEADNEADDNDEDDKRSDDKTITPEPEKSENPELNKKSSSPLASQQNSTPNSETSLRHDKPQDDQEWKEVKSKKK